MVLPRSIFGLVPTMRIHAVALLSFECRHWRLIPRGPRSFEPGVPTQTWRGSSSPTSSPWDALHSWDPASHWFEQFELLPLVTWISNLAGLVQGKNLQETMFFPCKSSLKPIHWQSGSEVKYGFAFKLDTPKSTGRSSFPFIFPICHFNQCHILDGIPHYQTHPNIIVGYIYIYIHIHLCPIKWS